MGIDAGEPLGSGKQLKTAGVLVVVGPAAAVSCGR